MGAADRWSRSLSHRHRRGTAHWGGGVRLRPRGRHALVLAYRFQHFSNGNQLGSNPGVNSHVVLVGWSYRS
jgi:opacity protein-like surface antigen